MAITNGNFYGEIAGRNIYSFLGELNYELQTSTERIEHLKKVLYTEKGYPHPFFEKLFEQTKDEDTGLNSSYVKLILNTTDPLYTDTNIADVLRKMADYVLFTKDAKELEKRDGVQYKVYKDARLFEKIQKELSLEGELERLGGGEEDSDIDGLIHILVKESNCTKEKGVRVFENDFQDEEVGSILRAYQTAINRLRERLERNKTHIELIENIETFNEETCQMLEEAGLNLHSFTEARDFKVKVLRECKILAKHIHSMRQDMLDAKHQIKRPIEFKHISSGSTEPDFDDADLGNEEQVKLLMVLAEKDVYDLQDDYEMLQYMVNELVKDTNLTKLERRILELVRAGYRQDAVASIIKEEFLDEEVYQQKVSRVLDEIAWKLAESFRSSLEAYRIAKGELTIQTKVCSKCGEEKPHREFGKDSSKSDGLKSHCKECRKG